MPNQSSDKHHKLPADFTSKPIRQTTLGDYKDAEVVIKRGDDPIYRVSGTPIENLTVETFEAMVCTNPMGEGHMVTFRHPHDTKKIVGVIFGDPSSKPEIDGVWVADDGGGEEPPVD
ncbi:MAG: hypothetical protein AAFX50_23280 [Acidobacteriota bacterium]